MLLDTFPARAEFRERLDSATVVPVGARAVVVGARLDEVERVVTHGHVVVSIGGVSCGVRCCRMRLARVSACCRPHTGQ